MDSEQIVTTSAPILEIDLKNVQKSDLDLIVSSFKLSLTKTDYIHALVAWFEVMFVGHKITTFSTGPRSKNTHWK